MNVTYTNRKGYTYYLCRGTTKTGKPRYYFAREPKGDPVEQIPEGYEIRESVNGILVLAMFAESWKEGDMTDEEFKSLWIIFEL